MRREILVKLLENSVALWRFGRRAIALRTTAPEKALRRAGGLVHQHGRTYVERQTQHLAQPAARRFKTHTPPGHDVERLPTCRSKRVARIEYPATVSASYTATIP